MVTSSERFRAKYIVDSESGCWMWTARVNSKGYGYFLADRRSYLAHRWVYEQKYGAIPDGMVMDHYACDRPSCVNPDHVRPVTPRENALRGNTLAAKEAAKTRCPKGHPYDEANTYVHVDPKGPVHRTCRICRAAKLRDPEARRRYNDNRNAKRAARISS